MASESGAVFVDCESYEAGHLEYGAALGIGRRTFEHADVYGLTYARAPSSMMAINWRFSHASC
jgi:hypothetical protein